MLRKHFFNLYINNMAAFNQIKFCLIKLTLHLVRVSCSQNSPILFPVVFWGETNRMFLKFFCRFHRKTPVLESLFSKVAGLKESPTQVLSCKISKILKNTSSGCFWTKKGGIYSSLWGDNIFWSFSTCLPCLPNIVLDWFN